MRSRRGSVGRLAVVLAAMGGCVDSGPEARKTAEVPLGQERSALTLGAPVLVRDLQPTPPPSPQAGSHPSDFVAVGSTRFFVASDPLHGAELWTSDGTPEGTVLVKDLVPGSQGSNIGEFTVAHGVLYFLATHGYQRVLWRSDGTIEGTVPLLGDRRMPLFISELEAVNDTLYLSANGGSGFELWTSDGTNAGTQLVRHVYTSGGTAPQGLRAVGGTLYFTADDGVHGRELWKSDGTAAGTGMVKDLAPGAASTTLGELAGAGDVLYFTTAGSLWKSDGTPEGTVPLTNVLGGPIVSEGPSLRGPGWLKVSGGTLYFSADDGTAGYELWKSDGSPKGTVQVKDIHPSGDSRPSLMADANGVLLFLAWHPDTGREVWTSDGTADGTVRLTDIQPGGGTESVNSWFAVAGSRAYFFADRGWGNHALWMTDGTPVGTRELRSLAPESSSAGLSQSLGFADGSLLFVADDGVHGVEPWKTDGTPEGTVLLKDLDRGAHGSAPRDVMDVGGGRVLFSVPVEGSGLELWASDGTDAGTRRLHAGLRYLGRVSLRMGGVRYFNASTTNDSGAELWRSDGTPEGTFLLRDFYTVGSGSMAQTGVEVAGRFFFFATTAEHGAELWVSDGTREGTVLVKDIRPGPASSLPSVMLNVGGTLYFAADDGVHGRELWKSDGTAAGTVLVKDLVPGATGSSPMEMENLNGSLVFTASDAVPTGRNVLWRLGLDGQLRKIALEEPGLSMGEQQVLRVVNGTLLVFTDASFVPALWSYDGTSEHATLLSRNQHYILVDTAVAGRVLYFQAGSGLGGVGLWRTDGTAAGTYAVMDGSPGHLDGSYYPSSMLGLADRGQVLFRSSEGASGVEMWTSDGTEVGSYLVADVAPGPRTSDPRAFTRSGDSVFFRADDGVHGSELWLLSLPPVSPDTTLPVLVCPAAVTLEASSASGATASWPDARVSDDVSASIPLTYSHVPGTAFPLGTTVVTVTARDAADNEAGCAFDVVVRDSIAPVVSCPADVEVAVSGPEGTPVTFAEATASDGVTARPEVTYSHASGSAFPVGQTVVTATARDVAGNAGTCTFRVTVRDTTKPSVTCPAAMTVEATGPSGAPVTFAATATDDGTVHPKVTYSPAPGGTFPMGETSVTVTAKDAAGNAATCSFGVVVRDTTAPVLTCLADVEVETREASGRAVEYPEATASDAVTAIPEVTYSHVSGNAFPVGTTLVTATVTDAAGNSATCSFGVTVKRSPGGNEEGSGCAAAGGSPAGLLGLLLLLAWPSLGRARARRS
ncbi:ELWxxDGT repeat protein [Archangium lansingense]|uniref:HYR domain-containing protein n=1 Tax=Archangium lansingense TaxID=2995310 RepID=A0ABT3ZVA5_9BACT|nr:ELWxxDGT repeat protein [Archangium lansinium]MCY1073276.1 HYR domain-containing protein [Archangium lansinium]